jgi:peptidoglycan/xylan/chitin deacetylase (PgdA/CDA1 family)
MTFDDDRIDSEKIMSADELRSLPEKLISVGSHTLSHPWLPDLPQPQAQWELAESRTALGDLLGREVRLFSFPYGAFDDKLLDLCRVAGYSRVFTTVPSSSPLGQAFVVGRVRVDPADWTWEFRLKLSGAYQWLPLAFALKRKIMCRLNSRLQVDALGMNTCPVPSNARKDYE